MEAVLTEVNCVVPLQASKTQPPKPITKKKMVKKKSQLPTSWKRKDWEERIKMSNICVPSTDGMSILCLVCLGKGKNKGVVGSRHAFAPGSYDDHCTTKKHSESLAHKKAEKKKKEFKHKTQKPMVNFFKIVKKKKGTKKELMKSTAAGEDDVGFCNC